MNRIAQLTGLFMLLVFALAWPFYAENFAIQKENRLRAAANGWVSMYADLHLRNDVTFFEKVKKTVAADSVHGRFRPAFFFYTTIPYALSPLIHGRSSVKEGRSYRKLINGDSRLFSFILLMTLGLSFVFMSIVIYFYTGEIFFSLIPIFFIPLSHSLTFNLNPGVIDSQEIVLLFMTSMWLFFLFIALKLNKKFYKISLFALSLIFLTTFFFIKEIVL